MLDDVFRTAERRVIVACFSSHVHRVQQVLDAAQAHERTVAFVGRSMVRNMGVARDLGLLRVPPGLIVDAREIDALPDKHVCMVSTGSQGEPLSALSRMANRDHPVRIEDGDTIILASSLIPGNENAVYRVINGLTRWGARVIHKDVAKVHVSGHAPAGELLYVLNMTRPSNVIPIHGEWRHLRAHAELAIATGVPADRVLCVDDGMVVDLVDGEISVAGQGRLRLRLRRRPATSATSPRSSSKTGGSSATKASSPSPWWSTRPPARLVGGPEIFARGFSALDRGGLRRGAREGRRGAGRRDGRGRYRAGRAAPRAAPGGRQVGG